MAEPLPIRIPHEFVNDDVVKLLRWSIEDGHVVREGQTLAEVETSKAVIELAAAASGTIQQRAKAGTDLRVGEIVGYILRNGEPTAFHTTTSRAESHDPGADVLKEELPADTRFSKKALELLSAHGLSATIFSGRGLVRERDVSEFLERTPKINNPGSVHFALNDISVEGVSLPASFKDVHRGNLEPEFLSELKRNPQAFASLSNAEKCEAYRNHGAEIAKDAEFGSGTYVIAPQIVIEARVRFGDRTSIECRERFLAGELTSFRNKLSVRGGTVVFGENVYGGSDIQIGGGGHTDPYSVLIVGNGTYIGDQVFINICRPVIIGKEVFLTQRSLLVTHNIGHSILEGYENRFAGIVLEDYSQIGMQSTIYAGVRVGLGSIVLSNSNVVSNIPPGKLAGGVTARVLRDARRPLDRQRQVALVHGMMREYRELLQHKGHQVSEFTLDPVPSFEVAHKGKQFQLLFMDRRSDSGYRPEATDESVIWSFETANLDLNQDFRFMDLLGKTIVGHGLFTESTREFLRKRGIRLEPGPWRYSGGLI